MASYSLDEFLGDGLLKDFGPKFADDGWDDVPTIKVIGLEDMEALGLDDAQRDALELRIYLHNRSLMKYAEKMEASGVGLIDLMSMKPADLASKFGMRKTHVTTFVDTSMSCGIQMPPDLELPRGPSGRRRSYTNSRTLSPVSPVGEVSSPQLNKPPSAVRRQSPSEPQRAGLSEGQSSFGHSSARDSSTSSRDSNAGSRDWSASATPRESNANASEYGFEPPSLLRPIDATKPNQPKGVFGASSSSKGLFGLLKAPSSGDVTKLSSIEKVSLRLLAPDHKNGVDPGAEKEAKKKGIQKPQTFKASTLFSEKPTLFFCIRRPGCVMCRAEAHQLFARKPIFDALGIQLVAVLLEDLDDEVWSFWPRYWAGMVVLDEKRDFFRALGGGKLMKDNLFTGFFLNPIARLNFKRATKTGIPYNAKGEGGIKGGLYIVRKGRGGVAYQFAERNFGDWAPLDEIIQVCHIIKEETVSEAQQKQEK
ncbi:hypothetical protein M758_1G115100 [Ceratodon purpureus]|nr:hypothetical protein M758_1G115100 [Ceratodon purpureus]